MAKSKSHLKKMDLAMAEELGLTLSPFTFTVEHVCQLDSKYGGFHFGFQVDNQIWYDTVELKSTHMGLKLKPVRFLLPTQVAQRLREKKYRRWYFRDRHYLYPMQCKKVETLFDRILFVELDDPYYRSSAIVNPDKFQLRKKPLLAMRPKTLTWDDCTILPSRPTKSTQPVLSEHYV